MREEETRSDTPPAGGHGHSRGEAWATKAVLTALTSRDSRSTTMAGKTGWVDPSRRPALRPALRCMLHRRPASVQEDSRCSSRSEWSLRNAGLYLFGTQALLSSCMLVMIGAYMIMGFMRVSTEGDGQVSYGQYPYPKTAFLPFGSTIWTLGILAVLSAGDLYIAIAAFGATTSATKGGLGIFVASKILVVILYLLVFGTTTEWMGSEVAIAICYLAFSLASTYTALMLFSALSQGGRDALEAGFPEGCLDNAASERRPLRNSMTPGYSTGYI